jgi:hypothetical protein
MQYADLADAESYRLQIQYAQENLNRWAEYAKKLETVPEDMRSISPHVGPMPDLYGIMDRDPEFAKAIAGLAQNAQKTFIAGRKNMLRNLGVTDLPK